MSEDTTNTSDDKSNDDTNEKKTKPHYTLSTENWEHQHEKKEKEKDPFTFPTSPKQLKAFGAHSDVSSTRTPSHLSREKLSTIKNKLRQQTYTGTGRDVQQLFEHFDTNHDGTFRSFLRRSLISYTHNKQDIYLTRSSLELFESSYLSQTVKSFVYCEYSMSNRMNKKSITNFSRDSSFRIIRALAQRSDAVFRNSSGTHHL